MNITNKNIAQWESDFLKTGNIELVPQEDRERVLHELDILREEVQVLLLKLELNSHIL